MQLNHIKKRNKRRLRRPIRKLKNRLKKVRKRLMKLTRRLQINSRRLKMKHKGPKIRLKNRPKMHKIKSTRAKKTKLPTWARMMVQVAVLLKIQNHRLLILAQMMQLPAWRSKDIDIITRIEGSLIQWTILLFLLEQMIRIGVHHRNMTPMLKKPDFQKNKKRLTNTKNTIRKIDFFKCKII